MIYEKGRVNAKSAYEKFDRKFSKMKITFSDWWWYFGFIFFIFLNFLLWASLVDQW